MKFIVFKRTPNGQRTFEFVRVQSAASYQAIDVLLKKEDRSFFPDEAQEWAVKQYLQQKSVPKDIFTQLAELA